MAGTFRSDLGFYIGRKECGCVVAASACDRDKKVQAKCIAGWIKDGMTIEQVSINYVKEHLRRCVCEDKAKLKF